MEAVFTNHDKITLKFRRRSQNFEGGVKFWKEVKNPTCCSIGKSLQISEGVAKIWKEVPKKGRR